MLMLLFDLINLLKKNNSGKKLKIYLQLFSLFLYQEDEVKLGLCG
jgi:hypothetical protein